MKHRFADPFFSSHLQGVLEEQKSRARLVAELDPMRHYRTVLEQLGDTTRLSESLRNYGTSIDAAFRSLSDAILRQTDGVSEAAMLAKQIESDLASHSVAAATALEALTRSTSQGYMTAFLREYEALQSVTASLGRYEESFRVSQRQIDSALASAEATARLYAIPELHWANTLDLLSSYEVFALRQAKRTKTDGKVVAGRRARATQLAGTLLTSSVGAAEVAVAGTPNPDAQLIEPVVPRLWGPLNQHLGFAYRAELTVEIDSAFAAALPTQICHVGGAIVGLLTRINEHSRLTNKPDVFQPTNRFVSAAVTIPIVIVGSDESFGAIVNALYFLLYEASGEGKRLVPLSSDDELAPLWRIRHLRLRYDHDIEHGADTSIRQSYAKIAAAFQSLISKNLPSRPAEWAQCQAQLYAQVYMMLSAIEDRLASDPPPSPK